MPVSDHQTGAFSDGTIPSAPIESPRDFQSTVVRDRGGPNIGPTASEWRIGAGCDGFGPDSPVVPNTWVSPYRVYGVFFPGSPASDGTTVLTPTTGGLSPYPAAPEYSTFQFYQASTATSSGENCILDRAEIIPSGVYACTIFSYGMFALSDTTAQFNIISQDGTQTINVTPSGFAFATDGSAQTVTFTLNSAALFGRSTAFVVQVIFSGITGFGFTWSGS